MIDVDATFKAIRTVYQTVSGKSDADVTLTYKGKEYGVTKSYIAKVEARELAHETYEGALTGLLAKLKEELTSKTKSAESEAIRLRQALNQLEN